jgi:hypothetical protein
MLAAAAAAARLECGEVRGIDICLIQYLQM